MGTIASQITSLASVYSTVWLGADQRKHQSSASLAFVRGIHRRPVNSPHKGPVTRKMFPFDDVIMGKIVREMGPRAISTSRQCDYSRKVAGWTIWIFMRLFRPTNQKKKKSANQNFKNLYCINGLWPIRWSYYDKEQLNITYHSIYNIYTTN